MRLAIIAERVTCGARETQAALANLDFQPTRFGNSVFSLS